MGCVNAAAIYSNLSVGTFDRYCDSVNSIPRLTPTEEYNLAVKLVDDNDMEAAQLLILSNLRFVLYVANGFKGYGIPLPDLVQEGNIGLMKAVKCFDPRAGVKLATFAVKWIRCEIYNYVITNWGLLKVATTKPQRKLFFNLRKLTNVGENVSNSISAAEAKRLSITLDVPIDEVYRMEQRLKHNFVSYDMSDDTDIEQPENFLYNTQDDPAVLLEKSDGVAHDLDMLSTALTELDPRSLDIVTSRWLSDIKPTLGELALKYNVSDKRIHQIEKNAIKKLKEFMELPLPTEISY